MREDLKWKTYYKTAYKNLITKYLRITPELQKQLEVYSKTTWLSQSYIMNKALIEYLTNNN